jgi:hypothetical protein
MTGKKKVRGGRITKFSTVIHTSREGLNYYFVEVTGSNGCRYVIQAHGEEAGAFQKETNVTRADTYNSFVLSAGVV